MFYSRSSHLLHKSVLGKEREARLKEFELASQRGDIRSLIGIYV